jgi:hypothetical protein
MCLFGNPEATLRGTSTLRQALTIQEVELANNPIRYGQAWESWHLRCWFGQTGEVIRSGAEPPDNCHYRLR